jgi:hypothetical protein
MLDDDDEVAVKELRKIVETAERDAATGELILLGHTTLGIPILDRVRSAKDLRAFLRNFGFAEYESCDEPTMIFGYEAYHSEREWEQVPQNFKRFIRRRYQFREVAERLIDNALAETEVVELFANPEREETTLFKCDPTLLLQPVRIELGFINEELVKFLAAHPEYLRTLDPRRFEELVAELFRDFGYDVVLTPKSKDGGLDIRVMRKESVGTLLYLIECKRYAQEKPVGVDIVRGLYGVATSERASGGLIVTTSHFTRGAKEFADKNRYQLSLRDYKDLLNWLKEYPTLRKLR